MSNISKKRFGISIKKYHVFPLFRNKQATVNDKKNFSNTLHRVMNMVWNIVEFTVHISEFEFSSICDSIESIADFWYEHQKITPDLGITY